jgi:hypothetical protein
MKGFPAKDLVGRKDFRGLKKILSPPCLARKSSAWRPASFSYAFFKKSGSIFLKRINFFIFFKLCLEKREDIQSRSESLPLAPCPPAGMELAAWEGFRQRKPLKTSHAAGSMPKTLKTFASESLWHGAGCMVASGSLSMQLEDLH